MLPRSVGCVPLLQLLFLVSGACGVWRVALGAADDDDSAADAMGVGLSSGAAPAASVQQSVQRPVVLLVHGLMQDSEAFMVDTRERALAFW